MSRNTKDNSGCWIKLLTIFLFIAFLPFYLTYLIFKSDMKLKNKFIISGILWGGILITGAVYPAISENLTESDASTTTSVIETTQSPPRASETVTDDKLDVSEESSTLVPTSDAEEPSSQENANIITLGTYAENPIEWLLIDENGTQTLLISKYILDYKPFNESTIAHPTDWENSTIRHWLNQDFFNTAFSQEEQAAITLSTVQDYDPQRTPGKQTQDHIFLLNYDEAWRYFPSDEERKTTSTEYAESQTDYVDNSWWLINTAESQFYKYVVNKNGKHENSPRVNESAGIRPALWIKSEYINSSALPVDLSEGTSSEPVAEKDQALGIDFPRPTGSPVLRKGSEGNDVGWLQTALNKAMKAGLTVNSSFDERTDQAVREFQSRCGLVVDGAVGAMTIDKLVQIVSGSMAMPVATEPPATQAPTQPPKATVKQSSAAKEYSYILNTNTKKFHLPGCSDAGKIKEKNRSDYYGTRESVKNMGYEPCEHCNP